MVGGVNKKKNLNRLAQSNGLRDKFHQMNARLLRAVNPVSGCGAFAVTASHRRGGASTVAFEFAAAMASSPGSSVLLVDANLRHPSLHQLCSSPQEPGLVEVVKGETDLQHACVELRAGFSFLPAGTPHSAPVIFFESESFGRVVEVIRSSFSLAIFDSAALNAYPEAALLAAQLDGAVLVLEAEHTRWEVAAAAASQLEAGQARLLGAVLNKKRQVIPDFLYRRL